MGRPAKPLSSAIEACALGSLSINDAVEFTGIGHTEITAAIERGELETFTHNRTVLVPRKHVIEWLATKLDAARAERAGTPPAFVVTHADNNRPQRPEPRHVIATAPAVVVPAGPWSESIWSMGARTVTQAHREAGLSRQKLWLLMDDGTLTWKYDGGGRDTRLIAWKSIVKYLESLPSPI